MSKKKKKTPRPGEEAPPLRRAFSDPVNVHKQFLPASAGAKTLYMPHEDFMCDPSSESSGSSGDDDPVFPGDSIHIAPKPKLLKKPSTPRNESRTVRKSQDDIIVRPTRKTAPLKRVQLRRLSKMPRISPKTSPKKENCKEMSQE